METPWTEGPWVYYADLPSTEPNWHIVTTANRMRVIANVHIEPGNAVDVANANLIASAPALYEALYRLTTEAKLDGMDKRAGWDAWVSMADAALRAARGEQGEG